MEDLVRKFGLGVYVEPDSSDAVADGMATLLHGKLPDPDWEGYEAHATWETNVTRLLQATVDYLNGHSPQIRQFDALDEASSEMPELLNARRIHHQKTPHPKKRTVTAKKPVTRKKKTPSTEEVPISKAVNGHAPGDEMESHPVFPGFDLLNTQKPEPALEPEPTSARKRTADPSKPAKTIRRRKAPISKVAGAE
jgi:hypothetical protein